MTRVLCVTSWFPPHHFGGYERSCQDVMTDLAGRGHHVEVLTSDHRHRGVDDGSPEPLAAVHRALRLYVRGGDLWSPPVRTRLRVERHNQRVLADAVDSCRPDVVAAWHVGALSLGVLTNVIRRGLPLVLAVCDDWPIYSADLDPWARASVRHPVLARAIAAVARIPAGLPDLDRGAMAGFISDVTLRRCRASSPWGFPRSTVVHSGIDLDRFRPPDPEDGAVGTAPRRPHDPVRLLYVGRVDERKGIRTLLRALAELADAELVVDGQIDDRARAQLADWCEANNVADRVTVQTSDPAGLVEVYRAAEVCVFPSEWEEPFGLVPLEAMACGTPVVATGVGGSGEFLVDGGNCVLFEPGEPSSLAAAVRGVIDDPDRRDHVVRGGAATARHFGSDRLADTFEELHRAAMTGTDTLPAPRAAPELDRWAGADR